MIHVWLHTDSDSTWQERKLAMDRSPSAPVGTCSCGNHGMVTELAKLMVNHWHSAPNTGARQRDIIMSLATATVLLGADIIDNKIMIPIDAAGNWIRPTWYDTPDVEKNVAICSSCYRHLVLLPTRLPPEEWDVRVTEFESPPPAASALAPSIFFYMRRAARQICEWLVRPW